MVGLILPCLIREMQFLYCTIPQIRQTGKNGHGQKCFSPNLCFALLLHRAVLSTQQTSSLVELFEFSVVSSLLCTLNTQENLGSHQEVTHLRPWIVREANQSCLRGASPHAVIYTRMTIPFPLCQWKTWVQSPLKMHFILLFTINVVSRQCWPSVLYGNRIASGLLYLLVFYSFILNHYLFSQYPLRRGIQFAYF